MHRRYGNINPLSIAYATRLGLGPTNPGSIIVAQETLLFRWAGFSPALWLLIPAFSLDDAPPDLAIWLQRRHQRSSTTSPSHIPQLMFIPRCILTLALPDSYENVSRNLL
jgi:hypothetical protein